MIKKVTRRDFCNGIAIGTGMNFMGPMNLFGQSEFASQDQQQSHYYMNQSHYHNILVGYTHFLS